MTVVCITNLKKHEEEPEETSDARFRCFSAY